MRTKTLAKYFNFTVDNGEIIIRQGLTDIEIAISTMLNVVDDITEEEYKILKKTIGIMQKVEKK